MQKDNTEHKPTVASSAPHPSNREACYKETLDYLYNCLPMYHRIGQAAYKADITNTMELMEHLGHPERDLRCIHVAGTNGKGSVSHFLAGILQQAGYKVGLYTSPHLVDFRERIRINGKMIPREEVTSFVSLHKSFMEGLRLSFFEMTVGLAFHYFAREKVNIAVIEVGMGGRLDSTNVITPLLSVITNISFDHTQFLGDSLDKIAFEKAGIIKEHVPVVIGETHPETEPVFLKKAKEMQAPIHFADQHYRIAELPDSTVSELKFDVYHDGRRYQRNLSSPMSGWYQRHNLATLFQALQELAHIGLHITTQNIENGIANVIRDTGLHGRWETMRTNPLTICETAHNEDGVHCLVKKLEELGWVSEKQGEKICSASKKDEPLHEDEILPDRKGDKDETCSIPAKASTRHENNLRNPHVIQHKGTLRIVYGCVNDKDFQHIIKMMPGNATYYITRPSVPRALDEQTLYRAIREEGYAATCHPTCQAAIEAATQEAIGASALDPQNDDLVLITGSIYLVADAYAYFQEQRL